MSDAFATLGRPLDNTALSAYMACPREYYMAMHLHRRGAEGRLSGALAYGSGFHKLLEWHYRTGKPELAENLIEGWWAKHVTEEPGDYRTLGRLLLDYKRYRKKWGNTPEEEHAPTVGYPEEPLVEISAEVQGGSLLAPYAVKIDRVIKDGLHYIEDHKTTSRLDRHYYSGFELSNQMMGYVRTGQFLMPSLRLAGIRLNVIHATKTATNFERQLFSYTPEQLQEWERNTNRWIERLVAEATEWPSEEELLEDPERWPAGHFGTNGCDRKYGLCSYHSICRISPPFRARQLISIEKNPWNPLTVDD